MLNAVIFDIDGVLMDSFDANFALYQTALKKIGREPPTREEFRAVFHLSFADTMKYFLKVGDPHEAERFIEVARTAPYPMELLKEIPGVKPVLKELKKNYALGIVSNRRRIGIDRYFNFAKTEKYFKTVVGCEEVTNPKPHPEPLLLAAKQLGVTPAECAYVGDAHTDIEAGLAAGMKTILFGDAIHNGAHARAKHFAEIPALLAQWRGLKVAMLQ